jgi:HNH endonuclease
MNLITLNRNNVSAYYTPQQFWSLAKSGRLLRSDLIYDTASKKFLPAGSFADLQPYLPPKGLGEIIEDVIVGVAGAAIVIGVGIGAGMLIESIFSPPQPARKAKRRSPNYEPLEAWRKDFVRARDAEICSYCGRYDPQGHVDHKTSRADGGSNHLRNLTWACASCNCSKGRMNARQFRRLTNNQW